MDLSTAISKVRTGLERLVKDEPSFHGRVRIELRFRDGKVVKLKKVARRAVL